MSKYNVGDKFVLEIGEVLTGDFAENQSMNTLFKIKGGSSLVFDKCVLDKLDRYFADEESHQELRASYEEGRKAGREEAIKWSKQNENDSYKEGFNDALSVMEKLINAPSEAREHLMFILGELEESKMAQTTVFTK